MPGGKASAATLFNFTRQLTHGLLSNDAAFATGKRGICYLHGSEKFRTGPLAFLPQRQGFQYRIFLVVKAATLDGLTDKCFLIRAKSHFHSFQRRGERYLCQG